MKHILIILTLVVPFLSGCDFLRKVAGRPTGEQIENMRLAQLAAEEAALQARVDSLKREKKMAMDSLAALDSIRQQGGSVLNPSLLGGLFSTRLESRYYTVIGAFRSRSNAEQLLQKAADKGYAPALISFRNGFIAVGICPVNTLKEASEALKKVKN